MRNPNKKYTAAKKLWGRFFETATPWPQWSFRSSKPWQTLEQYRANGLNGPRAVARRRRQLAKIASRQIVALAA